MRDGADRAFRSSIRSSQAEKEPNVSPDYQTGRLIYVNPPKGGTANFYLTIVPVRVQRVLVKKSSGLLNGLVSS